MINSLKKKHMRIFIICLAALFSYSMCFSQEKITCSCPLFKGKILEDKSVGRRGDLIIQLAQIKSKRQEVYSASPGIVTSIDTISSKRIYVRIEYKNYTFMYDNLVTVQCIIGQTVERGTLLGKLDNAINLILKISDGNKYIDPSQLLPCKIKVVGQ